MIDLSYFREHLDDVERMLRNRNARLDLDAFRKLDAERRQRITSVERLKAERNKGSEEVGRLKKSGQDAAALMSRMKHLVDEIKPEREKVSSREESLRDFMLSVANNPRSS